MPSFIFQLGLFAVGASAMAVPYGTGGATAPYSMGNTTVYYPTGTASGIRTSTVYIQPYASESGSVESADGVVNSQPAVDVSVGSSLTCESVPTVTVTATDRFTVTVTPGVTPKESSTASPSEDGSISSNPITETSATPEPEDQAVPTTAPQPVPVVDYSDSAPVAEPTSLPDAGSEDDDDDAPQPETTEVPQPVPVVDYSDSTPVAEPTTPPEAGSEDDTDDTPQAEPTQIPQPVPADDYSNVPMIEPTSTSAGSADETSSTPAAPTSAPSTSPEDDGEPEVPSYPAPEDDGEPTPEAEVIPDEVSYPITEDVAPPEDNVESEEVSIPESLPNTPIAAVPSPSYGSASGKGKRGLAYNDASLTKCFEGSNQITWAYNWAQQSDGLSDSFEFVPTLWGTNPMFTNGWQKAAEAAIASGSTHLLAFNEPDHHEQANISPAVAAEGYMTHMQPFAGKARLGAPGVTNGGGNMGLTWLSEFISACDGCTIDFFPIHWYDSAENIQYFKDHITKAHELTGKPIWVTEFGAFGSDAAIDAFLQEVLPWLDEQPFCERYSYFMVREGLLIDGKEMSSYGRTFANI